jgi:hypothetical protein
MIAVKLNVHGSYESRLMIYDLRPHAFAFLFHFLYTTRCLSYLLPMRMGNASNGKFAHRNARMRAEFLPLRIASFLII